MIPIRISAALLALATLSACGGGGPDRIEGPVRSFATGPIYLACLRSDRPAKSPGLCGCVQASADTVLEPREQARAMKFFGDPADAQVVRQSDRPADERFWTRYKQFVAVAERSCA